MKVNKMISLGLAAMLLVACSKSEDETDKAKTETLSDKASNMVTEMKEKTGNAAETAMEKGKEVGEMVGDKAKSAAEVASTFVKKGTSKVVETVDEAKQEIAETVENVKEKAADMMSSEDAAQDAVDSSTGEPTVPPRSLNHWSTNEPPRRPGTRAQPAK